MATRVWVEQDNRRNRVGRSGWQKLQEIQRRCLMSQRHSRLAGRDKYGKFEELDKAREKKSSTVEHLPLPGYGDVDR